MTWQDLAVAVIVGGAVVTLYRHLRGMLFVSSAKTTAKAGGASCHGCDDCAEEETAAPRPVEPR
ncbi:MAG: hypothetical protein F4057_04820 [Acidobacteria bacterium]|nr:hypothetical protein [Acidobacteriota bacterium]